MLNEPKAEYGHHTQRGACAGTKVPTGAKPPWILLLFTLCVVSRLSLGLTKP